MSTYRVSKTIMIRKKPCKSGMGQKGRQEIGTERIKKDCKIIGIFTLKGIYNANPYFHDVRLSDVHVK